MPPALAISADHARRFLVSRHMLMPPRALPAEPQSVLGVVGRLGLLQFDPLEVPGARNHDLVLHARIDGYRREWCDQWLYGEERRLIEVYNKSLNIVPIEELPHYAVAWTRSQTAYEPMLTRQKSVADAILAGLKADGPQSTSAFSEHRHAVDWWWAPTRAGRAVMEALFVTGRIGIARREGNRRHYDLIERLVPPDLLAVRQPENDGMRWRLLSRFRATGMTSPVGVQMEVIYSAGTPAQRAAWTAEFVATGQILPVEVDGLKRVRYVMADEKPILDATAEADALPPPGVTFLAPLDPLVWDRRLLRELWGFEYLWEVYVPAAKRRYGYYVLPILFGDRFVGRIEPRYERKTRDLNILGISFEPSFRPMEEPAFLPALREALEAYRSFVGADRVTWPRTKVGRQIGAALRRLSAE